MRFISTRGGEIDILSAQATINGIASDGGLYVPKSFPNLYRKIKDELNISYEKLALEIIKEYFTDFTENELKQAISNAYKDRFKVVERNNFLELYHGPTSAFKDAALLFLPQIMSLAKKKLNVDEEIIILAATSGDTGKAALEGFKNVGGFKVIVYYPKEGVSPIQEMQMITQEGNNVRVVRIKGNFDDAQRGVKELFGDNGFKEELSKKNYILSSANSINIGRLIPQIVYYFYGYQQLVNKQKIKQGDKINIVVPTGNFGNILAAYYAREMGLPIAKFICASNENNVLSDFFRDGVYDKRRELILTESPSMDILVSSNLERLLFEASGRDYNEIKNLMEELNSNGIYTINEKLKDNLKDFYGNYASSDEVCEAINNLYNKEGYLIDTHTAVAYVVLNKYVSDTKDKTPYLIVSTASPYKFPRSIANSLGLEIEECDDFKVIDKIYDYSKVDVPNNLEGLDKKEIIHKYSSEINELKATLLNFLGVNND
ncbi:threonine synthase [Clostridium sp. AL.422]|uniref:threonine synthase n=1 Tax=Clostridium TaxID=1485 RepID=UPI00293DFD52|nr:MULTISPECIES: threonine synthase [unclassified Clostridium]MDV4149678.1 threonine synthase [Clostridium sp. AL.422]